MLAEVIGQSSLFLLLPARSTYLRIVKLVLRKE